jgi:hypothetical protein
MNWMMKHTVIAGLLLIAGVNAIVLAGAFYNRSGMPDSTLRLTERELKMPYEWRDAKENSGLALDLHWRVLPPDKVGEMASPYYFSSTTPIWLDEAKMLSLGFDPVAGNSESVRGYMQTKELFLVLEQDGPAYKESLKRAERDSKINKDGVEALAKERENHTRLFVVDAGLEPVALRAKFPDRHRYAITRGQIHSVWQSDTGNQKLVGSISELSVNNTNVPFELRKVFEGAGDSSNDSRRSPVQYQVDVSYGQRYEPWITSATRKARR